MLDTTCIRQRSSRALREPAGVDDLHQRHLDLIVRLLGSGGDAVFVHRFSENFPDQAFCQVNEAASRQTGLTREELLSVSFVNLLPPEGAVSYQKAVGALRAEGSAVFEATIESGGGRKTPVEVRLSEFEMGGEHLVVIVSRDISERLLADEQRRKLSGVVMQSPAVVMITDVHTTIEYVNPKFEESTGFTAAEAIGKTPRLIQSGLHSREFYVEMWASLREGRPWTGELCNRKKSGELYWEAAAISPVRSALGEVTHYLAVKEDITERKRLEAALRLAKEAAEEANRAKSSFLANMSHEIRTPMNAILGFTQLMQRDRALTPQQKQYLDTISRSGEHLLGLINSVLEMSKIESGRVTVNPTLFDLCGLVKDLETMFRQRIEAKRLRFIVECAGNPPRAVVADESKLRQVLINLLGNAVKFTDQGAIALRVSTKGDERGGLRLKVEIEDTGQGIAKDEMKRLFRHFEQTRSGQKSGTGTVLGLVISREYVRLMGGELSARSEVGEGSLFHFEIRVQEADDLPSRRRVRQVVRLKGVGRSIRVLVADDSEDHRRLLVQMLEAVGFETLQASNGDDAVRIFAAHPADLIIMDVRMPVVDGYEAIRRVRRAREGKSVPIIGITASVFSEDRKKVLAVGADEFLGKPFMEAELYEKLSRLLEIDYEYASEPAEAAAKQPHAALSAGAMAAVPRDLAARLREATLTGNLESLHELLDSLARHNVDLAGELRRLADQYDYETLFRWLSTGG